VAVLGPTAAGKSEAALQLAATFGGEIVNCDSLQLYRYLNIGTAKLAPGRRRGIPHHLINLIDPDQIFTAGDYARRARPILDSISHSGRLPIVAGGTGFYFRALIDGLVAGPGRDEQLRGRLAGRESRRSGSLHRILTRLDPIAARKIHPHDIKKLVRALEICLLTRDPLTKLYATGRDSLAGFRVLKLVLDPPREALFAKIDRRARLMFEHGLVEELRALLEGGYPPDCKPFEALGYRQALQVIRGQTDRAEAIAQTQRDTRRYAKRQWTWFRKEPDAVWIPGFGADPSTQDAMSRYVVRLLAGEPQDRTLTPDTAEHLS